jgi:hypothetical protein
MPRGQRRPATRRRAMRSRVPPPSRGPSAGRVVQRAGRHARTWTRSLDGRHATVRPLVGVVCDTGGRLVRSSPCGRWCHGAACIVRSRSAVWPPQPARLRTPPDCRGGLGLQEPANVAPIRAKAPRQRADIRGRHLADRIHDAWQHRRSQCPRSAPVDRQSRDYCRREA